jgi:hypothetical protein
MKIYLKTGRLKFPVLCLQRKISSFGGNAILGTNGWLGPILTTCLEREGVQYAFHDNLQMLILETQGRVKTDSAFHFVKIRTHSNPPHYPVYPETPCFRVTPWHPFQRTPHIQALTGSEGHLWRPIQG